MVEQLLSEARSQTERSDPPVKAAALLHLARVWTAFDRAEAERLLETGITLAFEVSEPASDAFRSQAVTLAAAVSPRRALDLMPLLTGASHGRAATLVFNMLRHGHLAEAISYLSDSAPGEQYPYTAATEAIDRSRNDEESQRNILRGAIRARLGESGSSAHGFDLLFALWWSLLAAEEGKAAVRHIVQRIVEEPDGQTQSKFSKNGGVARFSSIRESSLFGIFGVVLQLDAELADSLCREYPQLAGAVVTFPEGYHTEFAAMRAKGPPERTGAACEQPDYITVGHSRLLPIPEALRTEFREPFEEALRLYALDTDSDNPNQAPRECWPSAVEFRSILFKAGQHEGRAAARYLDRIPDRDLRLFAQIELVAGIAGLPQFGGMSIPPRPRSFKKIVKTD
jgi:hypothetical protein